MSKKKNTTPHERHSDEVFNELFGSSESEPDIETDIADLGKPAEDDTQTAPNPKKHRFFFGFAVFVIIMAIIGTISTVRFISNGIESLVDNTPLKNEFARFLLPVVANDVSPFENESEISNYTKVNCAVWNILVNWDTAAYKSSVENELLIPEYDVNVSCKEIFGTGASLTHQTVGSSDNRFTYDEQNHLYSCSKNLRYLSYAPKIVDMTESNGSYVLTVEYLPPSITMVSENLGIEVSAEKTMEYTINRWDGKNTLMSVRFIDSVKM